MKRKQNGVSILHTVNDRSTGIYVETDILNRTITFREGLRRRRLPLWKAERLEWLLKKQINRINDRWRDNRPKEADNERAEFLICPDCGEAEKSTANFCGNCGCELNGSKKGEERLEFLLKTEEEKFERLMNNYLKSNKRVLFPTGSEGAKKEDVDSDATCTSGHS